MSRINALVAIRNYLQTDENPIDTDEFMIFWEALTPEEQGKYRTMKLN